MRIRSTRPEFWRSKTIAQLDWDVRLVLKGLEAYVDDNGVGKDDIELIAADVFPRDLFRNSSGTLRRLSEAVTLLCEAGLVVRYEVENEQLIYVDKWKDIQYVQKPKAGRFPRPDGTWNYNEIVNPESYRKVPEVVRTKAGEQGSRGTEEKERETRASVIDYPALYPLPDDWAPSLTAQSKAKANGIKGLTSVAEDFRNHALSTGRLSANWDAAFATWLASAKTLAADRERHKPDPGLSTTDAKVVGWHDLGTPDDPDDQKAITG